MRKSAFLLPGMLGALMAGSVAMADNAAIPSNQFWEQLQTHCGNAYAGKLGEGQDRPEFTGDLVMHVKTCSDTEIKIPFFVGEDLSRTWVLTKDENNLIQLKHDHRHEDGSEEDINLYGGKSTNVGHSNFQFFPADPATAAMIPDASSNVWWIELSNSEYSYNLNRLASDRAPFRVEFDLTKPIDTPKDPWGWKE
ncbi:hypothetical protein MMG00_00650 [Ignatzschineria rhizosphaerae]|uniref:Secreted protein n=1 Tax=Ignatzschineria rhizosphaerae TaxID=2923279 RepID=A0ABY3X0K8_9GAMM|nr:hypothetical protein [Ignatzschineria rhizosphaerae]UNM96417.1 hypothetical protein MMG00_00650 [Ignatzschineria rhizosphaerae]